MSLIQSDGLQQPHWCEVFPIQFHEANPASPAQNGNASVVDASTVILLKADD
jgi:hypothetical protein